MKNFLLRYSFIFGLLLTACGAPPTVKIGLVAPFEGLHRASGYEALFAVKLAIQERNAGDGLHGYRVELVALNDFSDPAMAARQAQALIADPDVLGVVGHLAGAATQAAVPQYQAAEMALSIPWAVGDEVIAPDGVVSVAATESDMRARLLPFIEQQHQTVITTVAALDDATEALYLDTSAVEAGRILQAVAAYEVAVYGTANTGSPLMLHVAGEAANGFVFVSPGPDAEAVPDTFQAAYLALAGIPPGPRAVLAYDAASVLLDALEQAIQLHDTPPTRQVVARQLAAVERQGLTGPIRFDRSGIRQEAPVWIYQIEAARYPGIKLAP